MSRDRENTLLTFSQRFCYKLPVLAICFTSMVSMSTHGQKVSSPSGPAATSKSCDGQLPPQTSSHQGPADPQSATEGGSDRLKLSTRAAQESSDAQGQFCKRERPGQNTLRPSETSDQSGTASDSAQPAEAPPIAQLTDGKLTIRANGQDFASVLESVRSATGFTVEMPSGVDSEPVFLSMGPASVTDSLITLMEGTKYNYIIVGSEKDPRLVKRLILSERTSASAATLVASTQGAPGTPQPSLYGGQGVQADTEAEASEPPPPPPPPTQPSIIPPSVPTGVNIQQLAAQSNKTPGQILDELQKHQQQVLDDQASQSQSAPQQ
jgi:hypothetical protein